MRCTGLTQTGKRCKRSATGVPAGTFLCAQHGGGLSASGLESARVRDQRKSDREWRATWEGMSEAERAAYDRADEEARDEWDRLMSLPDSEWKAYLDQTVVRARSEGSGLGGGRGPRASRASRSPRVRRSRSPRRR